MEGKRNNQVSASTAGATFPAIVLASASPRRAEILRTTGWPFETLAVNVDETRGHEEEPVPYVERLAREKAAAAASQRPAQLVLGADTIVTIDKIIFGKPRDEEDAVNMLRRLSGNWHEVLTGVALVRDSQWVVGHAITRVKFAEMSENEIDWYVSTGEPMDKAGAYAIQGRGARFIEEIEGEYFNVVGLPVRLLYRLVQGL